jgi:hypothetical protein
VASLVGRGVYQVALIAWANSMEMASP